MTATALRGTCGGLTSSKDAFIFAEMSTAVDLPTELLESVDHEARKLGVSRDHYIVQTLQRALATETQWSAHFVEELAAARSDDEGRQTLKELVSIVTSNRNRKAPPGL